MEEIVSMADKTCRDFLRCPVQDSHDNEKPLATPRQETGVPQGSELTLPGQPQKLQGEISPRIMKLAVYIVALLVFLLNLLVISSTIVCTMARAAVQYFQIPQGDVEEMKKMKHEEIQIKNHLKGSGDEISKLEKFSDFPNHSTVDLGEQERNLRIAGDRLATLANCRIDIKSSQRLVSRQVSDAQTVVERNLQVITALLASAALGYWHHWTFMPEVWKCSPLIVLLFFLMMHQGHMAVEMVHKGNQVKRGLEESRRCCEKSKVTLMKILADGGSLLKKIKTD